MSPKDSYFTSISAQLIPFPCKMGYRVGNLRNKIKSIEIGMSG